MRLQGLELPAYVLGALTATGGAVGYARTRSVPSIVAGVTVGLLCKSATVAPRLRWIPSRSERAVSLTDMQDGLGGYRIQNKQPYGVELGLLASVILGGSSIPRAIRLRKPVPVLLSLLATFGIVTFGDAFRRTL